MALGDGKLITLNYVSPDMTLPTLRGIIAMKRQSEVASADATEAAGVSVQTLLNRVSGNPPYFNTTSNQRPVAQVDSHGNKYLAFDGSNDYMAHVSGLAALPVTRIITCRLRTVTAGVAQTVAAASSGSSLIIGKIAEGTWVANNGAVLDSGVPAVAGAIVTVGVVFNGASSLICVNGAAPVAGNTGNSAAPTTLQIAKGSTSTVQPLDFYRELVYTRALSATQLMDTCAILAAAYPN